MYNNWVQKLATREYADELVVLACALHLNIQIVCIPYTPSGAERKWKISRYSPISSQQLPDDRTVFLGNNDVHFMLLEPH